MMKLAVVAVIAAAAVCQLVAATTAADDLITDLPSVNGTVKFKQYAGYVNVDAAHDRNLFYWFTESQSAPSTDPLVLWLNGGPGCSSVGGGLMSELGPLLPDANGILQPNPWAWNMVANVIYLESPAGVGFSWSGDKSDYTTGDAQTATDSYTFLQGFLERFPEYEGREFWVTGESYGGHYVPQLSAKIVEENAKAPASGNKVINFKGFMAGNAWTDSKYDNAGAAFDWWSHALISDETYTGINTACNFSDIGPLFLRDPSEPLQSCNDYLNAAHTEMGRVNIYDIYVDVCTSGNDPPLGAAEPAHANQFLKLVGRFPADPDTIADDDQSHSDNPAGGRIGYDPCIGDVVTKYLNRLDVQQAIHANTTLGYAWSTCSPRVNYSYKDLLASVLPTYKQLIAAGVKILVYSGDVDAIVPTPGTRSWLRELDLTTADGWRPWFVDHQTAGYVTVYKELTFTTVRNAGHMVPYMQPSRAFHMFTNFLHGNAF